MTDDCRGYQAERAALTTYEREGRGDFEHCVRMANNLAEHFEVEPVRVKRARADSRRSWFRPGYYGRHRTGVTKFHPASINLEIGRGFNAITVAHEFAHYLTHRVGHVGHGVTWAEAYVRCVENLLGEEVADRLHAALVEVDLLSPVTPMRYNSTTEQGVLQ